MLQVTLYTDGSCIGKPGPGGYGVVLGCNGRFLRFLLSGCVSAQCGGNVGGGRGASSGGQGYIPPDVGEFILQRDQFR